jgi:MFS family permease
VILWIGLFLFGASISVSDVAKNAQAIELERRCKRPIMTSFHAIFSVGGGIGALFGSALAGLGIAVLPHFLIVAAILTVVTIPSIRYLLSDIDGEETSGGPAIALPLPALWPLGAVAFAAALAEGAMADWSTVYMTNIAFAASGVAGLGYAAFSIMMTIGRASGDALSARITPSILVRTGGIIAAVGLAAAALIPIIPVAILGFALVGIGLSVVIPLAFSAAGNMPAIPSGTAIASVATIGYSGFLAGPPVIGLIAQATSLRIAFGLVALLVASLFFSARSMRIAQPLIEPAQ